jgi:hypothetical protein
LILTKHTQSAAVLSDLQKKMYANKRGFLNRAYELCMADEEYNYMIIDKSVKCKTMYSVRTGILPGEVARIFMPVVE